MTMQIVSIRFADADQSGIEIETTEQRLFAPWPVRTWHGEVIDAWLTEGNTIAPYVEPPALVPDQATVLQLYDEMDQTYGIDLEAAVGGRGPKALTRFRIANTIKRSDPMVTQLQAALGWSNAQVDALFIAAAAR
jgi:hypothetical protein